MGIKILMKFNDRLILFSANVRAEFLSNVVTEVPTLTILKKSSSKGSISRDLSFLDLKLRHVQKSNATNYNNV